MLRYRVGLSAVIVGLVLVGSVSPEAAQRGEGRVNGVRHITDELVDKVERLEVTTEALESQTDALEREIDVLAGITRSEVIVDCDAGDLLQDAINASGANTTILVEGMCNENISIAPSKRGMTIDGQGAASISAASGAVISISGAGITIRNFTFPGSINGGGRGIVVSNSASARIVGNVIEEANNAGISVEGNSFATIVGNVVRRHGGNGIAVAEGSTARIGTDCTIDRANVIAGNGQSGIAISESSEATIRGNSIRGNTTNGIFVTDSSMADTASNSIGGNGGDGVDLRRGSSVRMGRRDTPDSACADDPNVTEGSAGNNAGVGIDCDSLSTVDGELGTLNGDMGASMLRNTNADCPGCCFTSLDP